MVRTIEGSLPWELVAKDKRSVEIEYLAPRGQGYDVLVKRVDVEETSEFVRISVRARASIPRGGGPYATRGITHTVNLTDSLGSRRLEHGEVTPELRIFRIPRRDNR